MSSALVIDVNQENFSTVVSDASGVVLADFWAPWCPPCRAMGPVMDELAKELENKLTVVKINVDENSELASKFNVRGIPKFIFFKDGKEISSLSGMQEKSKMIDAYNEILKA